MVSIAVFLDGIFVIIFFTHTSVSNKCQLDCIQFHQLFDVVVVVMMKMVAVVMRTHPMKQDLRHSHTPRSHQFHFVGKIFEGLIDE